MKTGWPTKTLGEVCGFVRGPFGGTLKKSGFVENGFAVYEQQHAIYNQFEEVRYFIDDAKFQEMQRFELHPNDLIMSCSGTMGKVAIVPGNIRRGIINQALLKLTPTSAVSPDFLKYWMDSTDFQDSLKEQSGGAAIQNVASVGILKQIQISLPSLREQQRIVGIIDEAFDGIATAKVNARKNLQNASALFDSHLQSVFTQRGKGWLERTFEDVCHKITDGTHHSPQTQFSESGPGRFPYITSKNIRNNYMDLLNVAYIERAFHDEVYARCQPSLGDVLLTKDGANTGTVTLNTLDKPFSLLSSVCLIKTNQAVLRPAFLCYYLQSSTGLSSIVGQMTGAAIKRIVLKDIKKAAIPFPPLKEQDSIVTTLNSLLAESQHLESIYQQKLAALEALKKSLLHKAFTGEL
jgi:type I restriction enzyme, S subunit